MSWVAEIDCGAQVVAGRLTKVGLVADAVVVVGRACDPARAVGLLAAGGQCLDLD